jgi:hypothetical protein
MELFDRGVGVLAWRASISCKWRRSRSRYVVVERETSHLSLLTSARPLKLFLILPTQAFRVLATYIGVFSTPANERSGQATSIAMTAPVVSQKAEPEAIAMTAPVVSSQQQGGTAETMSFILPASFTMDTAPKPTDPRVKLVAHPAQTVAVSSFSWWCDMPRAEKEAALLLAQLESDKVAVAGPWRLCRCVQTNKSDCQSPLPHDSASTATRTHTHTHTYTHTHTHVATRMHATSSHALHLCLCSQ